MSLLFLLFTDALSDECFDFSSEFLIVSRIILFSFDSILFSFIFLLINFEEKQYSSAYSFFNITIKSFSKNFL